MTCRNDGAQRTVVLASAILRVFTDADTTWRTYRLPKASHTFDHKWQTEWLPYQFAVFAFKQRLRGRVGEAHNAFAIYHHHAVGAGFDHLA